MYIYTLMNEIPQELIDRISDFSIGNQTYWKTVFHNCLNEINQFSDEALVDKYLCNLDASVDEFILDFRRFITFCKQYKYYDRLVGRVFRFCCVEDHPFIDVMCHELLDMGMLYTTPGERYTNIFNECLKEIKLRGKIG